MSITCARAGASVLTNQGLTWPPLTIGMHPIYIDLNFVTKYILFLNQKQVCTWFLELAFVSVVCVCACVCMCVLNSVEN